MRIISLSFLFLLASGSILFAADATPRCLKTLAATFYDEVYLDQALSMHRIYQSTWTPIRNELKNRSRNVSRLMYEEGRKYRPNPLDHPINPKDVEKIFIKVMFQQFQETLNNFDIMNQGNIRDIFEYIRVRQQAKIEECLYR